jgi:8-oxo-dGTP diphosphatase
MEIKQRIACKAVIQYRSKVLILREADSSSYADGTNAGRYHLPGGRLEPGEAFLDGLAREVREETGLELAASKPRPIYVGEWRPVIRGEQNQIVAIFFVCTTRSSHVHLSSEHDDYQWIDPAAYQQYNLKSPEDEVLQAFAKQH